MTARTPAAELVERARANARVAQVTVPTRATFRAVRDAQGQWVLEDDAETIERAVLMGYPVELLLPTEPSPRVVVVTRAGRRFVDRTGTVVCRGYWSPVPTP